MKSAMYRDLYLKLHKKGVYRNRLERRCVEIMKHVDQACPKSGASIFDCGTAEGVLLEEIASTMQNSRPLLIGGDISIEMLSSVPGRSFLAVQSDALHLPFLSESFDIVIINGVVEHIHGGDKAIGECARVLKKNGTIIVAAPVPFFGRLFSPFNRMVGFNYTKRLSACEFRKVFHDHGVLLKIADKFMLTPFCFSFEKCFEPVVKKLGLSFLLTYQLLVGVKQ